MAINKYLTLNFEAVNDYPPIRFEIRFERKFLIHRSLLAISDFRGKWTQT